MPIKEDALNALRGAIGTYEDPARSNHNWITDWYADVSGYEWARRGNPWCMMTVTWALHQAGLTWFVYAYCPYVEHDAKAGVNGMSWGRTPQVGAVVLYDLDGAGLATHTGTVEEVYGDGTFITIEGNWGDRVARLHRDMKYVRGFAYMPYDGSPSAPAPPEDQQTNGRPILRRGSTGDAVKELQNILVAMGIDIGPDGADGDFGGNTERAVEEMQRKLGCRDIDGIVGPETYEALDRLFAWLAATNGQVPAPTPAEAPLEEDGVLGPNTISRLQEKIGAGVDGVMGTDTISHLQAYLGTPVDGVISRPRSQMVSVLQQHVGAGVDGAWGPDTTLHLQQALNAGTF